MANYQSVFQRYEKKYLLSPGQYAALRAQLAPFMAEDAYGKHTICNIYYDTETFNLIRHSLAKPTYKEKLRLRSYGVPQDKDPVFLELKKKLDGVVYKRRIQMTLTEAKRYLGAGIRPAQDSQILHEIDWFLAHNEVSPRVALAYDRVALFGRTDQNLRINFDERIRWREESLDLAVGDTGENLLPPTQILMEIKIPGVMPVWLCRMLAALEIAPVSFSKYGACYKGHLMDNDNKGGIICA